MNANELADELERPNNWQQENNFNNQAATMLRQQQAEIEALKGGFFDWSGYAKTLTDEEMKNLIQEYWGDVHIVDPEGFLHEIAFIKAILRKAQEK
jgi:hypothetical protein